ncbi:ST1A4-like protein, partial [Mya arenaria]
YYTMVIFGCPVIQIECKPHPMSRQKFYDVPGGDTIQYDLIDEERNLRLCTFGKATFEENKAIADNIPDVPVRDDDIFITSYPKTGTNWFWELLTMIISGTSEVSGNNKGPGMLEASSAAEVEKQASPRLLNSHLPTRYLPKGVLSRCRPVVMIARNPKDVAVSFYNHTRGIKLYDYQGKFENYLQMFMRGEVDYGSYPDYLRDWQTLIRDHPELPVLILYYEDLKQNFTSGKTLIFVSGEVGDWKNWFTVAQNEAFDTWWEENTRDIDMFSFRYTLERRGQAHSHRLTFMSELLSVVNCIEVALKISKTKTELLSVLNCMEVAWEISKTRTGGMGDGQDEDRQTHIHGRLWQVLSRLWTALRWHGRWARRGQANTHTWTLMAGLVSALDCIEVAWEMGKTRTGTLAWNDAYATAFIGFEMH